MESSIVDLIPFEVKFLPTMKEGFADHLGYPFNWEDFYNKHKDRIWVVAGAINDTYGLKYIVITKGELSRLIWADWLEVVEVPNCDVGGES